jgi:aminoglycoside 3-N-acetyltransferase
MTESETVETIRTDLLASGVRKGGTILVHSSLSALSGEDGDPVAGGPESVISGLLKALGGDGTLLMPALSYATVNMDHPVFGVRTTASNVGAIPEAFRCRSGTLRSVHPTHSVCGVGPRAADLLADHELDETPCGAHSPFRRLREGGQILFLGCGLRPNTSMHAVEEIARPPYLFGETVTWEGTSLDGRKVGGRYRRHGFDGWLQRYDRMESLLGGAAIRVGRVLEAPTHLMSAPEMWDAGLTALSGDPLHFVEPYNTNSLIEAAE